MLSPSTAPRWKTATRILGRVTPLWAYAARTRKRGMAPRPSRARAPPFMNERRVQWQSTGLSPLEFRRAQDEGRELVDISIRRGGIRRRPPCRHLSIVGGSTDDLGIVELSGEHGARLRPHLSLEQRGEEGIQNL